MKTRLSAFVLCIGLAVAVAFTASTNAKPNAKPGVGAPKIGRAHV